MDFPGVGDGGAELKAKGDAPLHGLSSFSKDDRLHDRDRHASAQDPRGQAISARCPLSPEDRPSWAVLA